MDTDVLEIQALLQEFMVTRIDKLTYQKVESWFEKLVDFRMDHGEEFDEEFCQMLDEAINALQQSLINRDKDLKNLKQRLVEDPSAVEMILSHMNLPELVVAEAQGRRLRSPELRQQFANMIFRVMEDLYDDDESAIN